MGIVKLVIRGAHPAKIESVSFVIKCCNLGKIGIVKCIIRDCHQGWFPRKKRYCQIEFVFRVNIKEQQKMLKLMLGIVVQEKQELVNFSLGMVIQWIKMFQICNTSRLKTIQNYQKICAACKVVRIDVVNSQPCPCQQIVFNE